MSVFECFPRRLSPAALLLAVAAATLVGVGPARAQSFRAAPMMATHIHPNSIAFADFNGDSLLDMAVPQYEWGLTIFLGDGAGGFTEAATYSCGTPRASIARDINADGRVDVIVSDERGRVWVFIGSGPGAFAAGVSYPVGATPYYVSAGDFNGDGKTDVATANSGAATISVLLGDGLGHFGAQVEYPVGTTPRSVVPADFNSDGRLDLAVANFGSNTVSLLLGDGAGGFGAAFDVASGAGPYLIATGDLNGDGHADLVVPNFNGGSVSTFFGDGAAHFTPGATIPTADSPRHAAIGDVNQDGRPDVIVANRYASSISVLLGTGGGALAAARTSGVGAGPFFTAIADLDRDGHVDLAVVNRDGFTISVLPGDGTGTYAAATPLPVDTGPRGATAADFDGDGRLDLALPGYYSNSVAVLAGSGNGGAGPAGSFPVGRSPWAAASADFDRDGAPDIAVTNSSANSVSILRNTGAFGFAAARNFATAAGPIALTAVDLNGDGKPDLVSVNASGNSISVLLGDGAGAFAAAVTRTVGAAPNAIASGDFNGDGSKDLAVTNGDSATVTILLGDGAGGFSSSAGVPTQTKPAAVAAGDFNGDLVPDLAVTSSTGNNVKILIGDGLGGFASGGLITVGTTPLGIAAGDLDGDGVLDLVTANAGANTVSVLRGLGNGAFSPPVSYGAGLYPRTVVLGDFDGDGRSDIAVANANTNDAWILINTTGHGDLSVAVSDGVAEVSPGQRVRYTLTVRNAGPSDVGGAVVSALFPPGTSDVQWTCAASSGSVCGASGSGPLSDATWIRVGGVLVYSVDATLPSDATGTIETRGTVTMPPGDDPNSANNEAADIDTVLSNHAPVALDQDVTTPEDTALGIAVGATDADGDPLTWRLVTPPQHGTLTGSLPSPTYTPAADFNGTDAFAFQVNDGRADSNIGTVRITVAARNDSPVATPQTATTEQDTTVAVTLSATDPDGDTLSFAVVAPPAHGSLSGTGAALTYTPAAGYRGPDSFAFEASDGQATSAAATVSITVTPVNHQPVLAAPIPDVSVNDDATVAFVDLTPAFSDPDFADGDTLALSVAGNSNPSLVTPSITGASLRLGLAAGVSGTATIRVRATDSHGLFVEDELVVSVARPPLNVSIADASAAEGNTGTRNLIFTLTLSASPMSPVTVSYTTLDGSATAGADYAAATGTVTFNPGVTSRTITLLVSGDPVDEIDETILLRLTGATGAAISRNEAVGTIVDDDVSKITIADLTVTEGNDGSAVASFQVSLSNPNSRAVTVDYATGNSTAISGADYTATSGTLTFAPGVQLLTIAVPIAGDTMDEPNEKFTVGLGNPVNAIFQRAVGTATIVDDDAPPSVSIDDVTVTEGNGSTIASFVVHLSAPSGFTTRVQFATSDGTALAGSDYRAGTGTVTFAPGVTTGQVNVVLLTNRIAEPTETFFVTLSAPTLLTIDRAQATGTIVDDDGSLP